MSADYPPILGALGKGPPVTTRSVGGGCIADARIATFEDGSRVFVKTVAGVPDLFEREAEGLEALAAADAIRVPEVLAVDADGLVLEFIARGSPQAGFFASFGRRFARLHRHAGPQCGFPHDNYIGATPQVNRPLDGVFGEGLDDGSEWPGFFVERRLRYQARLAEERGHGPELLQLLDRCEARLYELLTAAIEPPCVLHGDLWSGNFMVDETGGPCLIDPAVYYGHREADLAMTRLFGGFDAAFYRAYDEEFPLAEGHEERLPAYQLYHLLNHLNLFGSGYYGQCERILRRYQ
jgi:fructosamine-3-kinase